MRRAQRFTQRAAGLVVAVVVLAGCGSWRGIANVPLPGGPGGGNGSYSIYVEMPTTLGLNTNSRVLVADVFVGSVRRIEVRNWVALLTVQLNKDVRLPKNATAKIGQTSLLGSQHLELAAPVDPDPDPRPLANGDTIPVKNSSAYPTTEQTLASLALVLRGGGIPNLEVIQNEAYNILNGRAGQIRLFLEKLATFTDKLNRQRDVIAHAIDAGNRLLGYAARRADVIDRVLTEFPPLIKHFAEQRELFANAVESLGRLGDVADQTLTAARTDLRQNLLLLQRPLKQLGLAAPDLIQALKLIPSIPWEIDSVPKTIRGDYLNASATFDFTLSTLDNSFLTGTRFSGALRALEQSWGRDPSTMVPDVRFTPNPADAPPDRGE